MKKIILIFIMLSLFTVCFSSDTEDEKVIRIIKMLEEEVEQLEKIVAKTKIDVGEEKYKSRLLAEDMAVLAESDRELKSDIDSFQKELEVLEESIREK